MTDSEIPEQTSSTERLNNLELGKLNLGVYAYDSLKHLGDHFSAALEEQAKEKAKGGGNSLGGGWHDEQIRRWSKFLFLHLGMAQGREIIEEQTVNGLVRLAEDTPGLSEGVVDNYLDNWDSPDSGQVRENAHLRYDITDPVIQILISGKDELSKSGDYGKDDEAINRRVEQASLFLRGKTNQ